MDKAKQSRRYNVYYTNEVNAHLSTASTADKIQDVRHQLEEVLASAYNKRTKRTHRSTKHSPVINDDQYGSKSLCIKDSSNDLAKNNPFQNDCAPTDVKLLAYKKFITSLTRIVQDSNQNTPNSFSMSTSINIQNASLGTQKRSMEEKGTFLIRRDLSTEPYIYQNEDVYETQRAEKTTYCRPVAHSQEILSKTMQNNARLQQLVKKLVQAREKEKQNEAWKNYINELKNKHGYYDFRSKQNPKSYEREDKITPDLIDDSYYDIGQSWKQPRLCQHMFNNILYEAANNVRGKSNIQRRTWCVPSTSKPYKYNNNSLCCPISSQGRLLMMKKELRGPGYTLRPTGRYFRGSTIVVDSSCGKKLCKNKSRGSYIILESRSVQTTESIDGLANSKAEGVISNNKLEGPVTDVKTEFEQVSSKPESPVTDVKSEFEQDSSKPESPVTDVKTEFEQVSSLGEQLKQNINQSRDDNNQNRLFTIEYKLDMLIQSFNKFLEELKSKKIVNTVKCESVSCSLSNMHMNNMFKTKTNMYNVLTKHNIMGEVAQQKPYSTIPCSPCPVSQGTINDILNEEKHKSDKVKEDIDKILNSSTQCALQITIDIPTKEHSTEVTSSFYKRQQEDMIEEEIEPTDSAESEELEKIERSMTIAVNTDPMGILALFRVSAETVKQVLSYVPNLDYVTCLARRQLGSSGAVARYVCNICSASFTRPSALNDHIQGHNVVDSKNCCVCRHVLDRLGRRSGLFACAHCGQLFTRAYCRELHEQTCSKAGSQHGSRPSLVMLT